MACDPRDLLSAEVSTAEDVSRVKEVERRRKAASQPSVCLHRHEVGGRLVPVMRQTFASTDTFSWRPYGRTFGATSVWKSLIC